ncbi:hypothetical protein K504DRAFT_458763 [Pleomassaria siparia CBS 279.74]|uniref:Zn(2)-C6 fungal-type domain-containing protein n=1 Tax=Pleomassaria siparia CBS 279.74 TaxID=1314801 RepID=A0A6G1K379_9PLEO|nr:hypothetical protein K504DRAFT_458763 [Pleomassaria siparia CBS 279.74]
MDPTSSEPRPINRVALACIQCRSRHVKCDATQPICTRCKREGKECNYQKSRRGGLDKAALARRRLAMQQQAERFPRNNQSVDQGLTPENNSDSPHSVDIDDQFSAIPRFGAVNIAGAPHTSTNAISFLVNPDRLLDMYYENFHPSLPVALPLQFLCQRRSKENHGLQDLLLVMRYIGSIYAAWTPSDSYYERAYQALHEPRLPRNGFSVQALMLFAIAQHHSDLRVEARTTLDVAIAIALEIGINSKVFAQMHGERDAVLEESLRRTYYFLHLVDQHFSVVVNNPIFAMRDLPSTVDLPCDEEFYERGQIPPTATWQDYEEKEFAEAEVIYSSIAYLHDICRVVSHIMRVLLSSGTFSDGLIASLDAKVALWQSSLPPSKKDPLQRDGKVDEVMFLAHMICTIILMNSHRPFSTLVYSFEELTTISFASPIPHVEPSRQDQCTHTARALRAADMHTKLLAIPCDMNRHNLFTLCITASTATAQVSACSRVLEDDGASIARDRVRLSIGYLCSMSSNWPLAKKMAQEVKRVARRTLSANMTNFADDVDPNAEVDIPRDDVIWPIGDVSSQIDIYNGLTLPMNWDMSLYEPPPSTCSTCSMML